MNTNFLFLNEKKSSASSPLWENIRSLIDTPGETLDSFYCRLSVTMLNYFYRWYLACIYTSNDKHVPIDSKHLDVIVGHFTMITAHVIRNGDVSATRDDVLRIFKRFTRQDMINVKNGNTIDTNAMNVKLYERLTGKVFAPAAPAIQLDRDCIYFDAVGTVIWLWIHLTAGAIVSGRLTIVNEFWEFFEYLKYLLTCGICRHHYDTRIHPIVKKVKISSKDVLMGTIILHAAVNVNKYETRNDYDTIYQSSNDEYYKEYVKCWN